MSLNPAQKLAYLVPRKGAICLDISYMGLMHIAQQSGAIKWCQSAIVRKNDQFHREGLDKHRFTFTTISTLQNSEATLLAHTSLSKATTAII
ncbi:RecT protein [Klebsiella grimontii]|nr:RecT protein [Klebsiella grimontii]